MRTARGNVILAVACGGVLAVASPLAAMAASAPVGSSEGTVAQVGSSSQPIVSVSHTQASSSGDGSSSSANVVEVGGNTVVGSGGSNQTSGSVLDTGSTPAGRVEVAPWSTSSGHSGSTNTASGDAAVAKADVAGAAQVGVARSHSESSYTTGSDGSTQSCGSTSTDGVTVAAGGSNVVDLLHSDASCNGRGSTYLINLGGTQIGTSDQVQTLCKNLSTSVLQLGCDEAQGGVGSLLERVASFDLTPAGLSGAAFSSNAGGAASPAALVSALSVGAPVSGPGSDFAAAAAPAGPATAVNAATGSLPFTGFRGLILLLASIALIVMGVVVVRMSRVALPGILG
ncbi:MAG TPA: hypothetical protein VFH45_01675 [Acidimicrobiales bacterium]|nr:hypothetical protein [Acidimicrobiales bacterium]